MRQRPITPRHVPAWEGEIEGWSITYALRNVWRVAPDHDLDDLMQEARILFFKLKDRYDVREARHFMALFKVSMMNRVTNLANARTRRGRFAEEPETQQAMIDAGPRRYHGYGDVEMADLLASGTPEAIERLVRHLVLGEMTPRPLRRGRGLPHRRTRETTNAFLARIARLPATVDVGDLVRRWLAGSGVPEFIPAT